MPGYASQLSICNDALANLGIKPIQTLQDNNERAKTCLQFYDPLRRELLMESIWTFSKKEITLNLIGQNVGNLGLPLTSSPNALTINNDPNPSDFNTPWPWAFLYAYPANCLWIAKVYSNFLDAGVLLDVLDPADNFWWYDIQAAQGIKDYELIRSDVTNEYAIACNLQNAMAKFVFDTTDTSQFPPLFVKALSFKMSQRLCMILTSNMELKKDQDEQLELARTEAYRHNLAEFPSRGPRSSSFERARGIS